MFLRLQVTKHVFYGGWLLVLLQLLYRSVLMYYRYYMLNSVKPVGHLLRMTLCSWEKCKFLLECHFVLVRAAQFPIPLVSQSR